MQQDPAEDMRPHAAGYMTIEDAMKAAESTGDFVEYVLEYMPEEVFIGLPRIFKLRCMINDCFKKHGIHDVDSLGDVFIGNAANNRMGAGGDVRSSLLEALPSEKFARVFIFHLSEFLAYVRSANNISAWRALLKKREAEAAENAKKERAKAQRARAAELLKQTADAVERRKAEMAAAFAEEAALRRRVEAENDSKSSSLAGKLSQRRLQRSRGKAAQHRKHSDPDASYVAFAGDSAAAVLRNEKHFEVKVEQRREEERLRHTFNLLLEQIATAGGRARKPVGHAEFVVRATEPTRFSTTLASSALQLHTCLLYPPSPRLFETIAIW